MDLFDYLSWRGDLSFSQSKMNGVDALIFCQLSYLNFKGILISDFSPEISLNQAATDFSIDNFEQRRDLGLLINPKTVDLLFKCAESRRFANVMLCGFRDTYSQKEEEQFSALTFVYKGENKSDSFVFAAFRGTDDTIIGWKEDFNLAFMENLPAQKDALKYLEEVSLAFKKTAVFCGGHSKGGNLALYAGAKLNEKYQKNLKALYNFDGPGFLKENLEQEEFKTVLNKTYSYFPQGSIVGMLFEHQKEYKVIKSDGVLVAQHDPFNWFTGPEDFSLEAELDKSSLYFNATYNEWFLKMTSEKREQFVETLFGVLDATSAKTNSELAENWLKSGHLIIKAFAGLDKEIRNSALDTAHEFVKLLGHNFPGLLK